MGTPWQAPPAGLRPRRPQRPPLTKRMRPGHWMALDYLAAALCVLVTFVSSNRKILNDNQIGWYGVTGTVMAVVIAVAVSIPVAVRRRNPMAALVVGMVAAVIGPLFAAVVATTTSHPATGPYILTPSNQVPYIALQLGPEFFLPTAYVIYLVAALYRRTVAIAALGAVLALLAVQELLARLENMSNGESSVSIAFLVIIFWIVGYAAGQRRAYAAQLQDQAALGAVTEERLRIARELHDVVAHSMTVIAVQAGYGHHVIDEQPAKAREALGAIQATSREALTEMRRMLGVLRQSSPEPSGLKKIKLPYAADETTTDASANGAADIARNVPVTKEAAPLAPAPGLADLDRLVARIGNAGVTVDLRVRGSRRELPQGIDLAAFRIVQEALTNVVKHADTPSATVTVRYLGDEMVIEITDAGCGCPVPAAAGARREVEADLPSGGHGLIGMRERVSLYGGELTAQPLPERGFRVTARLPVTDDAP